MSLFLKCFFFILWLLEEPQTYEQTIVTGSGQVMGVGLQSEVSRLCRGLPGHGGSPAELGGINPEPLEPSL